MMFIITITLNARTLVAQGPQISDLISPLKSLEECVPACVYVYVCTRRKSDFVCVCLCLRRESGVLIIS